ncbi:MAG: hypothetical protein ACRDC6_14660 [Shewanella sp.]
MKYWQQRHSALSLWLTLPLVFGGFQLRGVERAYAAPSNSSLPVHGQGAPTIPTLIVPEVYAFSQPVIASAVGSTDPDDDPINYVIRWCTGANGTGECITGPNQIFDAGKVRYVSARAETSRGFPQSSQGASPWSAESLIRAGFLGFTTPTTTSYSWNNADTYCKSLTPPARLPTVDELQNVYYIGTSATSIGQFSEALCRVYGWPLGGMCGGKTDSYWSSAHTLVSLAHGYNDEYGDTFGGHVTCIR